MSGGIYQPVSIEICHVRGCWRGKLPSDSWTWSGKEPAGSAGRTQEFHMTDGLSREERTRCVRLFQSAALGATGLIPPTPGWFLLPTLTLCDTTLCDRGATRAQEPGPLFLSCRGQPSVGPATEHRCAHLPREGWRALQQHSPVCEKLPRQSEKYRESGWDITLCLGLLFFFIDTFIFIARTRQGIWVQTWFWHFSQS